MPGEWYCTRDGKSRLGPFTAEQLKQLATSGMLAPADLVWKQGLPRWVPASQVKGLLPTGGTNLPSRLPTANAGPAASPLHQSDPFRFDAPSSPEEGDRQAASDENEDEVPIEDTPTVGADLSNPLDRFAALMAVLWGLGSLFFLFLHVATGEAMLLLLTFVSFIGGGIALGLFVRWAATTQCPKCRQLWVKEHVDSTLVARQGGFDTVTRTKHDLSGKPISYHEEQVHVIREGYIDTYRCRRCRHRWCGRSAQQYEG